MSMRHLVWILFIFVLAISLPGSSSRAAADDSAFSSAAEDSLSGILASLKKDYPDDFAANSKGFWGVRQVCAEMARIEKAPKRSKHANVYSVSTYGADLYKQKEREMLPKMLGKRIAELQQNLAIVFAQNFCPALSVAFFQKAEYDLFSLAVDNLIQDVQAGSYAKCRDDIDREIGPRSAGEAAKK